jgi:hypothetical protein
MADLKLGPLPKLGKVCITITLLESLKDGPGRHAAEYSRLYEPVEAAALMPLMIEAFIRSDRGYRSRKARAARGQGRQREVGTATGSTQRDSGGNSA